MKQYNQDDIRRYVEGKMSDAEMHGIEKAALDDPFLADAIDGFTTAFQHSGSSDVMVSRQRLQEEFNERIKKSERKQAPVINIKWWQAVAAAAIIITAGVLGYQSYKDKKDDPVLSLNEKTVSAADTALNKAVTTNNNKADTNGDAATNKAGVATTRASDSAPKASAPVKKNKEESDGLIDLKETANKTAKNEEADLQANKEVNAQLYKAVLSERKEAYARERKSNVAVTPTVELAENEKNVRVRSSVIPDSLRSSAPKSLEGALSSRAAGVTISMRPASNRKKDTVNYFRGQIITSDDKPFSNAVLKLSDKNQTYTTDNNGNFIIPSTDSVIEVDVTMIGQESRHFKLEKNNDVNRLTLPDAAISLNEVVVVGYGTQRKRDMTSSTTTVRIQNAEPVGGWTAFETYIEKNKNPSLINVPLQTASVVFQVDKNGSLSNFKVTKSISPLHDQEAIRLIKDGPRWKLLKGRKTNVSVTINF